MADLGALSIAFNLDIRLLAVRRAKFVEHEVASAVGRKSEPFQPLGQRTVRNHATSGIASSRAAAPSMRAMKAPILEAGASPPIEECGRRRL